MRGRTSSEQQGVGLVRSLPRAARVLLHILSPAKPVGKEARISYYAEHQARENTRPEGNVDRI